MTSSQETRFTPSRRTVAAAAGAAGLAAALTACGGSNGSGGDSDAGHDTGSAADEKPLGSTSDIPQGGGKVFADEQVVVTQPAKGDFKAFTAICTHQGCTVSSVSGGTINCPCHGSKFSIEDGSVKHPPASQPLAARKIEVAKGSIRLV